METLKNGEWWMPQIFRRKWGLTQHVHAIIGVRTFLLWVWKKSGQQNREKCFFKNSYNILAHQLLIQKLLCFSESTVQGHYGFKSLFWINNWWVKYGKVLSYVNTFNTKIRNYLCSFDSCILQNNLSIIE